MSRGWSSTNLHLPTTRPVKNSAWKIWKTFLLKRILLKGTCWFLGGTNEGICAPQQTPKLMADMDVAPVPGAGRCGKLGILLLKPSCFVEFGMAYIKLRKV